MPDLLLLDENSAQFTIIKINMHVEVIIFLIFSDSLMISTTVPPVVIGSTISDDLHLNASFLILYFLSCKLTASIYQVNETYKCTYKLGGQKADIYPDSLFNCQAKNPSTAEMVRRFFVL